MKELEGKIKVILDNAYESQTWNIDDNILNLIEEEKAKSYNKGLRLNYYLDEGEVLEKFAKYVENKPISVESHYDEFDSDTISMDELINEYLKTLKK